ncbi:dTDP-4-dehydrorhamnose reductase [Shewanella halifaxensis HAW-EB4]|uniref:dTDP-4-dehydrorhamnose reductase n=1 Tax=Shewanella halifaxensis (strain HAW-EB4) TaxID=458817 RepID=B0TNA0_SHEHH|nr:dTDP-4-dehydrorhamnose reductase [Shewanella halifaxensis]ABZ76086.1 dTDP-4-dehydrorhamnose reductase [Shewanella halifaxensis HAW-EB4]
MRVLITGAAGQLGQALLSIAELTQVTAAELTAPQQMLVALLPEVLACIATTDEVIGVSHQQLDICALHSIQAAFDAFKPDVVINCAAFNGVDKAETDTDKAIAVNATGPKLLAGECKRLNIRLVHISTDFVFDGALKRPYTEQDMPSPLSAYGRSKLEGERWVNDILGAKATIIRTSWLYSCCGQNFVKTMQGLFKTRERLSVINDQSGSPTWCETLALVIFKLIKQTQLANSDRKVAAQNHNADGTEKGLAHLYHYAAGSCVAEDYLVAEGFSADGSLVAEGSSCSWYEFACEIQRLTMSANAQIAKAEACQIEPISSLSWQALHENRLAPRPVQSALNAQKVCHQLGIKPGSLIRASWQEQLQAMISYQKVKD